MNAKKDENGVSSLLGASSVNGQDLIVVLADPSSHLLMVSDGATGSDFGRVNAPRDENSVPVLMGVSSVDGITPIPIYADIAGSLLIKST